MLFDLQRFKGNTTNTTSYEPTEYELAMQRMQVEDYEKYLRPGLQWLAQTAPDMIKNTLGAVPVDYQSLNNSAQNQISQGMQGLDGLTDSNSRAAKTANKTLTKISNQYGSNAIGSTNRTISNLGGLAKNMRDDVTQNASTYSKLGSRLDEATSDTNRDISDYIGNNNDITSLYNGLLGAYDKNGDLTGGYAKNNLDYTSAMANQYGNLGRDLRTGTGTANQNLRDYTKDMNTAVGTTNSNLGALDNQLSDWTYGNADKGIVGQNDLLSGLRGDLNGYTSDYTGALDAIIENNSGNTKVTADNAKGLLGQLNDLTTGKDGINPLLKGYREDNSAAETTANQNLNNYATQFVTSARDTNSSLGNYIDSI